MTEDTDVGAETLAQELADAATDAPEGDDAGAAARQNRQSRAIFSVPVQVIVSVGSARPTIGELLAMKRDTLLQLDSKIDDPVELLVGKRVVARGELQEIEDGEGRLGVRLTEIVDLGGST